MYFGQNLPSKYLKRYRDPTPKWLLSERKSEVAKALGKGVGFSQGGSVTNGATAPSLLLSYKTKT